MGDDYIRLAIAGQPSPAPPPPAAPIPFGIAAISAHLNLP
jgi:hypothetical protein